MRIFNENPNLHASMPQANIIATANAVVMPNQEASPKSDLDLENEIKINCWHDHKRTDRARALQQLANYVASTTDKLSLENRKVIESIEAVFAELPDELAHQGADMFWAWLESLIQESLSLTQIEELESKLDSMQVGGCEQSQRIAMLNALCFRLLPTRPRASASSTPDDKSHQTQADATPSKQAQDPADENAAVKWVRAFYPGWLVDLFNWLIRAWAAWKSVDPPKIATQTVPISPEPAIPVLYGPYPPASPPPSGVVSAYSPKICI